jgi:polyhydroxyalkanoate synthesis regulator protein
MTALKTISFPTLWDLAAIVFEEVEKICKDEKSAAALSREIVVRIIQGHVKNMEIELPASREPARGSSLR